mmetsp:Transcript_30292/g.48904  ORF Transcript_30292/g.48904 Transcript_30292/m.48904 type:complete len:303 (+) Transcript_30292:1708-2616(+)
MERYGPMQGVDEAWASMEGSKYWKQEYNVNSLEARSRAASVPLQNFEYTLRPPRAPDHLRAIFGKKKHAKSALQSPLQLAPLRKLRGPRDAAPLEDYNHVLTFPPVHRSEILQSAGGSLALHPRTVPFKGGANSEATAAPGRRRAKQTAEILRISTADAEERTKTAGARPETTKSVHFQSATPARSPTTPATPASRRARRSPSSHVPLENKAATVWWLDELQQDEDMLEWVPLAEKVRPSTAERERTQFTLIRQRAAHMRRIVDYHRAGHEEVDHLGNALLPSSHTAAHTARSSRTPAATQE